MGCHDLVKKIPEGGFFFFGGGGGQKIHLLFSIKYCLPSKVVFYQRLSSIKGHLPLKVVFHQKLSSIKGRLPSKAVFNQRLSSIIGRLFSECGTAQLSLPLFVLLSAVADMLPSLSSSTTMTL